MNLDQLLSRPFTFNQRKKYISCELRPIWKMSLILTIFGIATNNRKCSLKKIHVGCWLVKNEKHFNSFLNWNEDESLAPPEIRFDPTVDRTIELLFSEGYITKLNGSLLMTEYGEEEFNKLNNLKIFVSEKKTLAKAKRYLSEAALNRLFGAV